MSKTTAKKRRSGGHAARKAGRTGAIAAVASPAPKGVPSGHSLPLNTHDQERVHNAALDILETIGVAGATPSCTELVTGAGGRLNDHGRLCFPRGLVEDLLAKTCRHFVMHGLDAEKSLEVSTDHVYFGIGGAAVSIMDFSTGEYRPTSLADLYDLVRLLDTLEYDHLPLRPAVAGDLTDSRILDLNTAYACISGTNKPMSTSFARPEHVDEAVAMFDIVLGGEGKFSRRPFCLAINCFMVPPLRFAADACACLEAQVRHGMPVHLVSASQAGATAPAALAGAVTQAVAECLAGIVYVNLLSPGHPVIFGPWPFVSDLRTGAMSGGSGEVALLMAACAQMGRFYGIPSCVGGGMTDSKVPDAQSGFEKCYTATLAALAGASLIQGIGLQASSIGVSYEGFVIDNEMLGAVLRMARSIEVSDETLSVDTIAEVTARAGHYLGHQQTHALMLREYIYPKLSDRSSPDQWKTSGTTDIRQRARVKVQQVLSQHYPDHIDGKLDARIRETFDIRLPRAFMLPGNDRW